MAHLGKLAAYIPPSGSECDSDQDEIQSIDCSDRESIAKSLNSDIQELWHVLDDEDDNNHVSIEWYDILQT